MLTSYPCCVWLIALFILGIGKVTGQKVAPGTSFFFEHYAQTQGLSQGTCYALTQYDGFMWFGTQDGLNRFDGYTFKVYRANATTGLRNNIIQSMLTDDSGRLWVGTGSGLVFYDANKDRFSSVSQLIGKHLLSTISINKLIRDRQNQLWILTDEQGLYCLNLTTATIRAFPIESTNLTYLSLDKQGRVWIVAWNDAYFYDTASNSLRPAGLRQLLGVSKKTTFRSMLFDQHDNRWVATYEDGVYRIDTDKTVSHYQQGEGPQNLSGNQINAMLEDHHGRIWIATRTGGISLYNPVNQLFTHIKHNDNDARSLAENFVWQFYEDQQGMVWVGFSSHGIDKYDPLKYQFGLIQRDISQGRNTLPDNMIFRLFAVGDDLYIGTETGGIARYSLTNKRFTPTLPDTPAALTFRDDEVRGISADSNNVLWLANWQGLGRFDPVRHTLTTYMPQQRMAWYLFSLLIIGNKPGSNSGEIWTGGRGGLQRFDMATRQWKSWKDIPALASLSKYTIRLMHADRQQHVWLGTLGRGLLRYNPKTRTVQAFNTTTRFPCDNIRSILEDGTTLWVGTDCGLVALDLITLHIRRHYTEQDGLSNGVIYGLLKDDSGNLWLSSNKGLVQLSTQIGNPHPVLSSYDVSDGLQSDEFNTNVCYRHTDGTLFFGGVNGINYFNPKTIRRNLFVPPVRITGITVSDSVTYTGNSLLVLDYDQNFVRFDYTALNFSRSEKNRYKYQLAGIDADWVDAHQQRFANYTKLPPGQYTFRVKASNNDGVWNEQSAVATLFIRSPFWQTGSFRISLIVLLAGLAYSLYHYRIYQLKRQKTRELAVAIQTQELERQRVAHELHDGIGANLAVLSLYINSLTNQRGIPLSELTDRSKQLLKTTLDDLRRLINDMHPRSVVELGLIGAITDRVAIINESGLLIISLQADELLTLLPDVVTLNIFRIVQELLQNVLKHAAAQHVWLTITAPGNTVHLVCHDDGRGMPTNQEPFSTGHGLANIKQRLALLNGTCHYTAAKNGGTVVTITIPV